MSRSQASHPHSWARGVIVCTSFLSIVAFRGGVCAAPVTSAARADVIASAHVGGRISQSVRASHESAEPVQDVLAARARQKGSKHSGQSQQLHLREDQDVQIVVDAAGETYEQGGNHETEDSGDISSNMDDAHMGWSDMEEGEDNAAVDANSPVDGIDWLLASQKVVSGRLARRVPPASPAVIHDPVCMGVAVGLFMGLVGVEVVLLWGSQQQPSTARSHTAALLLWVAGAAAMVLVILWRMGHEAVLQWLVCYSVDWISSTDNILAMAFLLSLFRTPQWLQPKVLLVTVIVSLVGQTITYTALSSAFTGVPVARIVIGVVLLISTFMALVPGADTSLVYRCSSSLLPAMEFDSEGGWFMQGSWRLSKLSVVTVVLLLTNQVFLLDTIALKLALYKDPFVLASSSAFAMMPMRSLCSVVEALQTSMAGHWQWGFALIRLFVAMQLIASIKVQAPAFLLPAVVLAVIGICFCVEAGTRVMDYFTAPTSPKREPLGADAFVMETPRLTEKLRDSM